MKIDKLIGHLQYLRNTGVLSADTEIMIPSDPDKDYDRTSQIGIYVLRTKDKVAKEIILADPESEIWKGNKKLN